MADPRIAGHDWWHAIEVSPGVVTPGGWNLYPTAAELPWPDVTGKRCLDIGTADGFWAFELERRGAAEVVATDLPSPFQQKARARFELARELRGSRVLYEERDVYDLDGDYDVVFMGFVLQMVRDPLGALEAIRRVCLGHLLLLDTVSLPLSLLPSPLARLDARRNAFEYFVFNRRGLRKAVELAGWTVEAQTGILRDHAGPAASDSWATGLAFSVAPAPCGRALLIFEHASIMRLDGIHHVTCITGDAPANVDFYTGVLGLRLVKKTVNQDDPTVYHLFYADEKGTPGSDITFFEYPGAAPGRAGAGMVHTVVWRVGSADALDFWAERLGVVRNGDALTFSDPEGLQHQLVITKAPDEPLIADHPEIPRELALQGFEGVRAYARDSAQQAAPFFEELGFEPAANRWETRGDSRGGWIEYEAAPDESGIPGAGTVHHVAWASTIEDEERWRERVAAAGGRPTDVIDRFWFRSIYFREPNGVLFEIATLGPGFATDEDPAHLGETLILPPAFEHLRAQVEPILTPLPNPRESWSRT